VRRGLVGEFVVHGGSVFTIGDRLAVHDTATGQQRRSTRFTADLADITTGQLGPGASLAGNALVFGWYDFATETGTLFCVDAATLATRWQWRIRWAWTERALRPTLAVVADDERVYAAAVGKDADNLFAFRLSDGALAWSRAVERFPAEAALTLHEGHLIVRSQLWARPGDRHQQLDAIRARDGERLWRTWLGGEPKYHLDPPVVHDGRLYTTTRDGATHGRLFSVRLTDGQTTSIDVDTPGAPFARQGDVLYLGGATPLALDLRTHRPLWRTPLTDPDSAPPMLAGGTLDPTRALVYVADSKRYVYALSATTGELRHRLRLDTYPRFEFLSPLKAIYGSYGARRLELRNGLLFVGTVDASLFVFRMPP
jgi:outer membrane protein assembly factor BamB